MRLLNVGGVSLSPEKKNLDARRPFQCVTGCKEIEVLRKSGRSPIKKIVGTFSPLPWVGDIDLGRPTADRHP